MRRWWTGLGVVLLVFSTAGPAHAAAVSDRPQRSAAFDGDVYAVAYRGPVAFVGGRFAAARDGRTTAERSRIAAVDIRTGRLRDWAPVVDGAVQAIVVTGDAVYVGGDFTRVNGQRRSGLAKLDAATGELDPDFVPQVSGRVLALAVGHGRLYVGGSVTAIGGQRRDAVGAVALDTGAVDTGWAPRAAGNVYAIAADSSRVYLGGTYSTLNGSDDYRKLAAVDTAGGAIDTGFRSRLSEIVRDLHLAGGALYAAVGGVGGQLIRFAADGTREWFATADGDFQAVTVLGDTVYAGGHFATVCSTPRVEPDGSCVDGETGRRRLAAFTTGGRLLGWAPEADSTTGVHVLAANPALGAVAAGGAFTTLGGGAIDQPHFAYFR